MPSLQDARRIAQQTGRPVAIDGAQGLYALPNGGVGTPGGGFGGPPQWSTPGGPPVVANAAGAPGFAPPASMPMPQPVGGPIGMGSAQAAPAPPQPMGPYIPPGGAQGYAPGALGQANVYIPPSGAAAPMAPRLPVPPIPPRAAMMAAALRNPGMTTDQLNAASLAAARAGLNYLPPGAANPIPTNQ